LTEACEWRGEWPFSLSAIRDVAIVPPIAAETG